MTSLPLISIITPSYNQAEFIEETIQSVLGQGYPRLEYIVIDGGSNDGSVDIIKRHDKGIHYWISEDDHGQADAINKGLAQASGDIIGYLNSDDLLLPGSLSALAAAYEGNEGKQLLFMGDCLMGGHSSSEIHSCWQPNVPGTFLDAIEAVGLCPQPATFWTRSRQHSNQLFVDRYRFCMDYEFWINLLDRGFQICRIDKPLAFYRHHDAAKGANLHSVMWSEHAATVVLAMSHKSHGIPPLRLYSIARSSLRHSLLLSIHRTLIADSSRSALVQLTALARQDPFLLFNRSFLGLLRRCLAKTLSIGLSRSNPLTRC